MLTKDILAGVRLFLLDMDGTFYLGNRLLPGAKEFLAEMGRGRWDYLFLTNNSSRDAEAYAEKLTRLGLKVGPEKILTSGEATIRYLKVHHPGARVFLLGTPVLEEEFRRAGIALVDDDPDLVVLGFDLTLTYRKLERACRFLRQGRGFIATHPDLNCPTEDGFIPDTGAMIAFIRAATGVEPKIIGKPYPEMIAAASAKTGIPPAAMAMIGDRLYTDIAMGKKAGVKTILVLTGETKGEDLEKSPFQPDLVATSLQEVVGWLEELKKGQDG